MSPCLFNLYAKYIKRNARLDESQAGIKPARRNINNLRYVDDTILMEESEEQLKSFLIRVKDENENSGLKLNTGPITSWQIDVEKLQTVTDYILGAPKSQQTVTGPNKRCLILGRKVVTNLDSVLKSRDVTLPTEVKAVVFPVVMYGCESWTIKKTEH